MTRPPKCNNYLMLSSTTDNNTALNCNLDHNLSHDRNTSNLERKRSRARKW